MKNEDKKNKYEEYKDGRRYIDQPQIAALN